jgi:hypothetical protein
MSNEMEVPATCRNCLRAIHNNVDLEWLRLNDADAQTVFGAFSNTDPESDEIPHLYRQLFAGECQTVIGILFDEALAALKGRALENCEGQLRLLAFLQHVFAVALWRYQLPIEPRLEAFAREFDRLDVGSERRRLHAIAQA